MPRRKSRGDDLVTRIQRLQRADERRRTNEFAAEGPRFLLQAAACNQRILGLLVCERLLRCVPAARLVRRLKANGTPVQKVAPETFRSVSRTRHASGVAFVAQQMWTPLARADPSAGTCWLAIAQTRSPGNLGCMLRTAAALGTAGVFALDASVDPFDPSALRGSMGAVFQERLVRTSFAKLRAWAAHSGVSLIGTSPRASEPFDAIDYPRPCVVLVGEEGRGLSQEQIDECDRVVHIPMSTGVDSLNVAVATGLLLHEVRSSLRKPSGNRSIAGPDASISRTGSNQAHRTCSGNPVSRSSS